MALNLNKRIKTVGNLVTMLPDVIKCYNYVPGNYVWKHRHYKSSKFHGICKSNKVYKLIDFKTGDINVTCDYSPYLYVHGNEFGKVLEFKKIG